VPRKPKGTETRRNRGAADLFSDELRRKLNPTAQEYIDGLDIQPPTGVGPMDLTQAVAWIASTYTDMPQDDHAARWRRAAQDVCNHASAGSLTVRGMLRDASPADIDGAKFERLEVRLPQPLQVPNSISSGAPRELCLATNRLDLLEERQSMSARPERVTFSGLSVQKEAIRRFGQPVLETSVVKVRRKAAGTKKDAVREACNVLWPKGIPVGVSVPSRDKSIRQWLKKFKDKDYTVSERTIRSAISEPPTD
jgi:hypothetical protein